MEWKPVSEERAREIAREHITWDELYDGYREAYKRINREAAALEDIMTQAQNAFYYRD